MRNRSNKSITENEFEYWTKMMRKKSESQFWDYNRIKNKMWKKKLCGESKRGKNNNERKWIEFEEEIDDEKIEFSQENVAENSFKVDTRFALIPC